MDAVKFIKEKQRMCKTKGMCTICKLHYNRNKADMDCFTYINEYPEEAVAIVEKWSQEHPRKTRLQDLLEKYPKAILKENGSPNFCLVNLGYGTELCCYELEHDCVACWNRPLEE